MPQESPPHEELKRVKVTPVSHVDSLWVSYIVSVLAAWVAEFVTYPLDLTKTRLQIQGELANKADLKLSTAPNRGMIATAIGISREEGPAKLWQGMSAGLVRHVIYSGSRMVIYQYLRDDVFMKKADEHFAVWKSALCGISAGVLAQYMASPADLVKVQIQMEGKRKLMGLAPRVHGLRDAFVKIWWSYGYKGLWKGCVPNMYRAAFVTLGDLSAYDYAKRFILTNTSLEDGYFVHVVASFFAGFVAAGIGTPADVINTRVMNQPVDITYPLDLTKTRLQIQGEVANKGNGKIGSAPYRGMLKTAFGIAREEGWRKLWQGMSAGLTRHVIYSGTRMVAFQFMRDDIFKKKPNEHFSLWKSAICGISAGAFAQYISSPTDLLKVQLQMEGKRRMMGLPPRVHGMADAFKKVWKASGYKGLWKGSVPNMQRAALVNLGDLTTYDYAKRFILMNSSLEDSHFVHVSSSFCAGFVAAGMGTPADVIKTRVMNQPVDENGRGTLYKSSIDCLIKTTKAEGFAALYKGFFPIWLRMAPWSLTFWLSYEEAMLTIRTNNL